MTDGFDTADPAAWKHALEQYAAAKAAWSNRGDRSLTSNPDPFFDRYLLSEYRLLTEPAPDFDAVIQKLYILWADEIEIVTPDSYPLLSIIEDVRRLSSTESEV